MDIVLPPVYLINMDKDIDRYHSVSKILDNIGIRCTRVSGIRGDQIDNEKVTDLINPGNMTKSEIGCALSHLKTWNIISLSGEMNPIHCAIIFEDDISTYISREQLTKTLDDIFHYAPDFDIVYLGVCLDSCQDMKHVHENIYRSPKPICTHAYMISKKFIDRVLANYLPVSMAFDIWLINLPDTKLYSIHPSMFSQDIHKHKSSLRSYYNSFPNVQECALANDSGWSIKNIVIVCLILLVLVLIYRQK